MASVNLNQLAKDITLLEGGRISLPIGQVKEVMKILLEKLAAMSDADVTKVLNRYR
jgi:hypothetical protein